MHYIIKMVSLSILLSLSFSVLNWFYKFMISLMKEKKKKKKKKKKKHHENMPI